MRFKAYALTRALKGWPGSNLRTYVYMYMYVMQLALDLNIGARSRRALEFFHEAKANFPTSTRPAPAFGPHLLARQSAIIATVFPCPDQNFIMLVSCRL